MRVSEEEQPREREREILRKRRQYFFGLKEEKVKKGKVFLVWKRQ
jgi:hypothetical protein